MTRFQSRAWFMVGFLFLVYISSFVDRQVIAVLATPIRMELGLSLTNMGILYGPAFSLVYAIMGLFMGRLADQYSRKYIILSGLLIWSLMTVLSGWANSFAFLFAARLMIGVSQASLSPAVYSILADRFSPAVRARVFSAYASAIFVGVGLSFLIGGEVAQLYDWRVAFRVVGVPGVFLALLGWFIIREPERKRDDIDSSHVDFKNSLKILLSQKVVQYHLIGFSLLALSGYTILSFIGTVLAEEYGASTLVPTYGWFLLATAISVNVSGWIADRLAASFGERYRFVMGMLAALGGLPFYAIGFNADTVWLAFWMIGLGNVISSSYNGVAAALIQNFVGSHMRGVAGAVYLFVVSLVGFGIGPPLTGWLIDHYLEPSQALLAVFLVTGIGATICFSKAMKVYPAK